MKTHFDVGMWNCFVNFIVWLHLLAVENDISTFVAHCITIVWRRKDCDALSIVSNFVAHVFDFVRANDVVEFVSLEEVFGDIGAFGVGKKEKLVRKFDKISKKQLQNFINSAKFLRILQKLLGTVALNSRILLRFQESPTKLTKLTSNTSL
jgi:hypothetical protein